MYIELSKPSDIKLKRVEKQISEIVYIERTNEIELLMHFTTNDKTLDWIINEFRLLKNKFAFERDIKNGRFKR